MSRGTKPVTSKRNKRLKYFGPGKNCGAQAKGGKRQKKGKKGQQHGAGRRTNQQAVGGYNASDEEICRLFNLPPPRKPEKPRYPFW